MLLKGGATSNVPNHRVGISFVRRSGPRQPSAPPVDNQAEVGAAELTIPGAESWAAGVGEGGDPAAASVGDGGEAGAAFSPDATSAAAAVSCGLASDGADWGDGVVGFTF